MTYIIEKLKKINRADIVVVVFIALLVLLTVGWWRLHKIRPEKEPINIVAQYIFCDTTIGV